jgi:uncharacterized protein (TIGR02246 family)
VKRTSFLLMSFALVSFFLAPPAKAQSPKSDLQILLSQFVTAWGKSDSGGIAALFDENSDLVIPDGLLVEGRDAIQKFYASAFERGYRGSHGTASIKHTRQIGPGIAVADGEWRIDGAVINGRAEAPEVGIFSVVATRRAGGWAISSLREQTSAHNLIRLTDARPTTQPQQSKPGADAEVADVTDSAERNAIKELEQKDIARADNPYAPLRLYNGVWQVRPTNPPSKDPPDKLEDVCGQIGTYFACQQTKNDKLGALLIFVHTDKPGHYYTQVVLSDGRAAGRGELEIASNRWVYSSKAQSDSKTVYYRTTNVFMGNDRIHYEQARSSDGEHWTVNGSGDEIRVSKRRLSKG